MSKLVPDLQFFGLGFTAAFVLWFFAGRAYWQRTGSHPWKKHGGYWFWTAGGWLIAGALAVFVGHEPSWAAPLAAGATPASVFAQLTGSSSDNRSKEGGGSDRS